MAGTVREKTIGNKYILLISQYNDGSYELAIFKKGMQKGLKIRTNYNTKKEVIEKYNFLNGITKIEKYIFYENLNRNIN